MENGRGRNRLAVEPGTVDVTGEVWHLFAEERRGFSRFEKMS